MPRINRNTINSSSSIISQLSHLQLTRQGIMQQSPVSSYFYPSSPMTNQQLYDSGYSSFNYTTPTSSGTSFQFTSCPYSTEVYYNTATTYPAYYSPIPYPTQQPEPTPMYYMNSTPLPTSNVCEIPSTQVPQPKRRRQQQTNQLTSSPAICPARKRISDEAVERLNAFYSMKKRPTEAEKDRLAMECNITIAQVNTWFNNARSRRGDTNPKLAQKHLKQQIDTLSNQVAYLQQQTHQSSSY